MRGGLFLALSLVLVAPVCSAAPAPSAAPSAQPEIDAFVADVVAKRRGAAIARIASMESVTGMPNAVQTPAQVVDKLMSCTFVSVKTTGISGVFDLAWRCADGQYKLLLDVDYNAPKLTVGQFVTEANWKKAGSSLPAVTN